MSLKIVDQDKPLLYRLSKLIVHAQFVWWLGHLSVVISTILYVLSLIPDEKNSARFYYRVFRGSMLSYAIVVWKGHKPFDPSYSYFMKIIKDETTSYLLLSFVWLMSAPVLVSVFPFFIFSVFHCINYVRTRLFPAISPTSAEELKTYVNSTKGSVTKTTKPSSNTLPPEAQIFLRIQNLTLEYYAPAMKLVSIFEVAIILPFLFFSLITFKVSILTTFMYGQFILRRASQSTQTRTAFIEVDCYLDKKLDNPAVPLPIKNGYKSFSNFVKSIASS